MPICSYRPTAQLRQALLDGAELALIDVREEADFARSHPLFAANLPLSKMELDVFRRVPRLTTPITVYDGGEGLAERPSSACRAGVIRMSRCWKAASRGGNAAAGSCFRT